ncbi:MAG: DUF5985 family protein [Gammaproteobacteria bacterium]
MNQLDGLLIGVIFTASLITSAFFVKYWRATRDQLFLAFAIAIALEGLTRVFTLFTATSYEGAPLIYVARLIAYLIILTAIFRKNRRAGDRSDDQQAKEHE